MALVAYPIVFIIYSLDLYPLQNCLMPPEDDRKCEGMERETRLELATSTLARLRSTN
jgi:hypothetical protein